MILNLIFPLWKPTFGRIKCICKEINKELKKNSKPKPDRTPAGDGRGVEYPNSYRNPNYNKTIIFEKTFHMKYEGNLSVLTKSVLNSFHQKYIYYAIDDILYTLDSKSKERENLLQFFYSSMMLLHNNFSINFFDIWIESIYINDIYKENRFLTNDSKNLKQVTHITLKLYYIVRSPIKKVEPIW